MDKPTSTVIIGGIEYPLYLNLYAVEEIQKKFGGMDKIGDKLYNPKNFSEAIDTAAELVVILANQGIAYENYFTKDVQRDPITVSEVKLLCSPFELNDLRSVLADTMTNGSDHSIESDPPEDSEKNLQDE